jgi:hypothetical protein
VPTRGELLAQHARRLTAAVAFWAAAVLFVADVSLLSGWLLAEPATAQPAPAVEHNEETTNSPSPLPAPKPTSSLAPAADDPTVALEGGATVTFPAAPTRSDKFVEVEGEDVPLTLYTLTDDDETTYTVAAIQYPLSVDVSDPAVNLLASASGAAGNAGGQITNQDFLEVSGAPAVDFSIETATVRLRARNVLDGRRLYSQTVAFSATGDPPKADDFFDSLQLPARLKGQVRENCVRDSSAYVPSARMSCSWVPR